MKREKTTEEKFRERPLVLRRRREQLKSTANWPLFYHSFARDHSKANLIWNHGVSSRGRLEYWNHGVSSGDWSGAQESQRLGGNKGVDPVLQACVC